jgi:hypothetical protein
MVKSGAKALGNIALRSGADFVGDVLAGRNVKEAAKARIVEAANVAKRKAINKLRSQTGSGKRAKRSRSVKRLQLKREKHRHLQSDAGRVRNGKQLKRERHRHLQPDADRPIDGKQLKTYLVKTMNLVHSKSQECTKSELDLFSVSPTQISLEKGHWVDHQPVSSVADGSPIEFLFPGTEDYVDLASTILVVRVKVTKPDGTNLGADEKVWYFS